MLYTDHPETESQHEHLQRKYSRRFPARTEKNGFFAWRYGQYKGRSKPTKLGQKAQKDEKERGQKQQEELTARRERAEIKHKKHIKFTVQELVPLSPKPACFDFLAQEEPIIVQEALDYAKNFFWVRLAPSSATTPHPEQLFYTHTQMSKVAFRGYMIAVTMGLNFSVAYHPQQMVHEQMRIRYTVFLLKEIRDLINDLPVERLDEIIATVLILSVTSELAVKPRTELPSSPFTSPLAQAQLLDFWGALKFDPAHLSGMKRLVGLRGGLDKMSSPDVAALVQMSVRSCCPVAAVLTYRVELIS